MAKKHKWGNWSPREKCVRAIGRTKRPKGLSYEGLSEYGTHFYRKPDKSFWILARRCGDGKEVYIKQKG